MLSSEHTSSGHRFGGSNRLRGRGADWQEPPIGFEQILVDTGMGSSYDVNEDLPRYLMLEVNHNLLHNNLSYAA